MTDESKLDLAAARARRAENLLKDDLLQECFKTLEDAYVQKWRTTDVLAVAEREKLFLAINVIGKVRDHLTSVLNDGKLAAAELKELANLAERKRLFNR